MKKNKEQFNTSEWDLEVELYDDPYWARILAKYDGKPKSGYPIYGWTQVGIRIKEDIQFRFPVPQAVHLAGRLACNGISKSDIMLSSKFGKEGEITSMHVEETNKSLNNHKKVW